MNYNEVKLRMVGSQGLKEILSFASFDNVGGEIVLPLLMHVCTNCGKIEFMAKGNKTQRTLKKS
jgi:hypothetical protein